MRLNIQNIYFVALIILTSCNSDTTTFVEPIEESPVVFNLEEVPYNSLSEYNFFEGDLKNLQPVYGVLPYDLNSTLFSDYAQKKRFVWMPKNTNASYVNDYSTLNFPTGAVLIKNFYYHNVQPENVTKIVETRIMIKKETNWIFANYVWNQEQTEAILTTQGSTVAINWIKEGNNVSVNYRIPSHAECFTCHNKFDTPVPIGPKPQNLYKNYTYSDGEKNQLVAWQELGYLNANYPSNIDHTVSWKDPSQPLNLRARSYIDINCAHCHSEESYCEYRPMRFAFQDNSNLENMGVCVEPDTNLNENLTHIIKPNHPEKSVVYFRISATEEQYRMPLLGRTLQHREGVKLIEDWINTLNNICE